MLGKGLLAARDNPAGKISRTAQTNAADLRIIEFRNTFINVSLLWFSNWKAMTATAW